MPLVCLPYAGGGASAFHGWSAALPAEIDVWAVELPGRERRFVEEPATDLGELVRSLAGALGPHLDRPYAIFGHSMGAILGIELARALRTGGGREPEALLIGAHRAPHLPPRHAPLHSQPSDQLLEALSRLGGTQREVLENPELVELMLPVMRADLRLAERFVPEPEPPLGCELSAFGGRDDPAVSHDELAAWSRHTSGTFRLRLLPGGHFFLHDQLPALAGHIADDLLAQPRAR